MESCQHFVLTRFNVDLGPHRRTWDEAWLAARFELFTAYCLPSMRAQTEQAFSWVVFFAAASRDAVEPFLATLPSMPNLHAVFTSGVFGPDTARDAVVALHDGVSTGLMTTRLDCDDALRLDVIARLQAVQVREPLETLNFPVGYQLSQGRTYLTYDPANAFCTLVEPWIAPGHEVQTVYCAQHQNMGSVAPVRQVDWSPSWVQLVHDLNLANTVNGLRVPHRRAMQRFSNLPELAALPVREDRRELLVDGLRSAMRLIKKLATRPSARRRLASLLSVRSASTPPAMEPARAARHQSSNEGLGKAEPL
jgi:hypothetical protein